MKIRIQNDGGPGYMTQLTDVETGQTIEHATGVDVRLSINVRETPQALVTTLMPVIDVIADAEIRQVCACCGKPTEQKPASAADVLVAFSEYANRIGRESDGVQVPVLKLYGDNSGCIRDEKLDIPHFLMVFNSIEDLLSQLEHAEEKAAASLYGHAHGEPNDG